MNLALVKTTVSNGKTKKKQTTKTKKKTIESSIKEKKQTTKTKTIESSIKENNNCNVYLDLPPPYKRRTSFKSSNASRLEKMKRFKMLQDVDALKTVLPSITSSSNHNLELPKEQQNARSIARQSCTIERIAALERKLERFTLRLTQNERRLTHNERRLAQLEATR